MKHLFIVNPAAGKKNRSSVIADAVARLGLGGSEIYVTACPKDAVREVSDRLKKANDFIRIYACGGDGTLNEVITGVYLSGYRRCAVASVPTGSGNDFIKMFDGFSASDFRDLAALTAGEYRPIDLMLVTDTGTGTVYPCVNLVSAGFDAAVADGMGKYRRVFGGNTAYNLSLIECLVSQTKNRYTLKCDGEELFPSERDFLFALGGNGQYYGGGYKAAPKALPDDGLIDFVCVDTVSRLKFISLVGKYRRGEHIDTMRDIVTFRRCRSFRICAGKRIPVNVDGEIILMTDPEITVLPGAINIILPKKTQDA